MYKVKLLNKISEEGLKYFNDQYNIDMDAENEDVVLVRSAPMHEYPFGDNLKAIARAGAGVNNIPLDKASEKGIVVFNTPGANANAVKELTLCALFLSSRKLLEGYEWINEQTGDVAKIAEKGKNQFVGPEIDGKKLGVFGLGAIGVNVANAATKLGMEVYGYDPYMSVSAAWGMSKWVNNAQTIDNLFSQSDYITLHAPSNKETKGIINKETIASMKDGVVILNFARGDLVVSEDIVEAVASGKVSKYVTDFADEVLLNKRNIIVFPHLGASTPESEDNCAKMAVKQVKDYIENGNIMNSVNFPAVSEPRKSKYRICIIHKNVPNMLARFATMLAEENLNIENMVNKAKGDYAYTLIDTNDDLVESIEKEIEGMNQVINVRVLK